ncbi:MAG TPA: outer membrane beta-barrel protein [Spirochaetales bacterium]|jgi:hypothetical protein|nr:outer membrane beta-barrel protein [Spirochaetales bacterium]
MKRKVLVVALIVCSLFTLSAARYDRADGFGIGLSAGYPVAGLALKYGVGNSRLVGTVGYNYNNHFALEAGVQYDLSHSNFNDSPLYLNIGITGAANFSSEFNYFSINVPIGLSFYFRNAPIELFLKLAPGMRIASNASIEPDFGAAFGILFYVN